MNKFFTIFASAISCTLLVALVAYITPASQKAFSPNSRKDASKPDTVTSEAVITETSISDRLTHPPESQTFQNGPYELRISATDQWQTPAATGTLYESEQPLWQQSLPHQYGPKFALVSSSVSSSGTTLLFDEYINIASDYAITLIASTGEIIRTHSFDDIHQALQQTQPNLTRADLTNQATTGWWISAAPTFNDAGTHALIETGGTLLHIELTTGNLTASHL
ncbi:MAG: hypothetical protein AB8B99_05240 [Phormidesmis sp.]